uniref:Uncharacterized protein n=1 Tax=Setaria italica TaxID=4555 RepID=K4AMK5_SETIT
MNEAIDERLFTRNKVTSIISLILVLVDPGGRALSAPAAWASGSPLLPSGSGPHRFLGGGHKCKTEARSPAAETAGWKLPCCPPPRGPPAEERRVVLGRGRRVLTMRIMQFSDFASWTVSRVPLGLLKGKAMESGTNASHARERNYEVMEEFLSSTTPILAHTALLLSLEKIT